MSDSGDTAKDLLLWLLAEWQEALDSHTQNRTPTRDHHDDPHR